MAKAAVTIVFKGPWSKLRMMLTPAAAKGRIRREMMNATRANGAIVRKAMRKTIKSRMAPPNAALTKFIKHSTKPLVDDSELFKAITSVVIDPFTAEIGVKRGDGVASSAKMVHDGGKIRVTKKMRAMFGRLAAVSRGDQKVSTLTGRAAFLWKRQPGGWKALKQGTTHIKIPARRFIDETMKDEAMRKLIGRNWLRAWADGLANRRFKARTK